MDGLKLDVGDGAAQQRRDRGIVVQKEFEVTHQPHHFVRRRRDETGGGKRAPTGADPVLAAAELARLQVCAGPGEQDRVDLLDQSQGQGERLKTLQAIVECGDVVDNVLHVAGCALRGSVGFVFKEISERGLCTFNLGRINSFPTNVHGNEQLGVGQELGCSVKSADSPVGGRVEHEQIAFQLQRRLRR
nr:hypothetical protein [Humisphaera borealis]